MILYMHNVMDQMRVDEFMFFRIAHQWRFGRDLLGGDDVAQYRLHAVIPKYAQEFLRHLQGKGGDQSRNPHNSATA